LATPQAWPNRGADIFKLIFPRAKARGKSKYRLYGQTLINVLKGDMSLVGPRPLLVEYLPLYNKTQQRRHEVRPGITGWAQINGRNELKQA